MIEYDWFGVDHMCINVDFFYWRGQTCESAGLLYTGGKNNQRTTYEDYTSFPMLQLSRLSGKYICGVPMKNGDGNEINFMNVERPSAIYSDCIYTKCGSGEQAICLSDPYQKCPINEMRIYKSSEFDSISIGATD